MKPFGDHPGKTPMRFWKPPLNLKDAKAYDHVLDDNGNQNPC